MKIVLNSDAFFRFLLFAFIVMIASILRFMNIDTYPDYLSSDSAKFGFLLLKALEGEHHFPFAPPQFEFDETGLVYLSLPIALCFNPGIVVLRSISAVSGLILVCCVFWFSHRLFNIKIAFISALFTATLPWLIKHDHFIHQTRFNAVCISYLIAIGLIYPIGNLKSGRTLISASIAGISLYFHGSSRLLPIIIFVILIMDEFSETRRLSSRIIVQYGTMWLVVFSFFSMPMVYALCNNPSVLAHKLLRFTFWDNRISQANSKTDISEQTTDEDSLPMKSMCIKKPAPSLSTNLERIKPNIPNPPKKGFDPGVSIGKRILKSIVLVCNRLFFMGIDYPGRLNQREFIINPLIILFFGIGLVCRIKFKEKRSLMIWLLSWYLAMIMISSGKWSTWYYIVGIVPIIIFSAIGIDGFIAYLKQCFRFTAIQLHFAFVAMIIFCLLANWRSYRDFVIGADCRPVTLLNLHYDLSKSELPDIPLIFYFEEISPLTYIPPGMIYAVESILKNIYYLDKKTSESVTLVPGSQTRDYHPNSDFIFYVISRPGAFHADLFDSNIRILDAVRLKKSDLCMTLCSGDLSKTIE